MFICDLSIIGVPKPVHTVHGSFQCGLCTCNKAVYIFVASTTQFRYRLERGERDREGEKKRKASGQK